MADDQEKPRFDPAQLLGQLKEIVGDNKDPKKGGGKSWVSTLIIIAVVLAGMAVWSWLALRRGRELAKLRHEAFKTKIMADGAKVKAKLESNDELIKESQASVNMAEEKLRVIGAEIRAEEARYEADLAAIDSMRNWNSSYSRES